MQLASGVDPAERAGQFGHRPAAGGLAAVIGAALRVLSARYRTTLRRPADRLLTGGASLAAASAVAGLVGAVSLAGRWAVHESQRTGLANAVAVGTALSGLVLCAGLLRRPGVGETGAAALRLLLDGLVIAAALWFVGFVLLSKAADVLDTATPGCAAILLAAAAVAVVGGVTAAVAMRSVHPRNCLRMLCFGVGLVMVGDLGIVAGLCAVGLVAVVVSAGGLAVGLLLMTLAGRSTVACGTPEFDLRRRTGYAFVPMLAMALAAVYHQLMDGRFLMVGVAGWIVEGFALVTRQYLALVDVRGIASRLAEREAHFRELAHTDPLTGLANRRGLLRAVERARLDENAGLLCLDLDGFKYVNDVHGRDIGDAVLREVAARLVANLRPGDLAARLDGDEFAVLVGAGSLAGRPTADRLLAALSRPYLPGTGTISLSVSIGLAGGDGADDIDELLRNADLALRFAKQQGRNRVEEYDIAYDQRLQRRSALEHDLRDAAERGELRLVFQPVVALPSVRPVGAEALLRWRHPTLGNVRPDEFIPLAEECGMIAKLGAWVLDQACHQLSLWLAEGHDVWLSVNVSPRELHAPTYVRQVVEALHAHRVPPQRLVLEITEHAVATDLDELIKRLRALRTTGVRIALDDFGAGYSSLGQLRNLPIDILKIDHSLVAEPVPIADGNRGRDGAPMVDVIMRLGHRLGLEVIAEGVTNPSELAAVVEAGCRFGQGQLFGWGVPAEHLEARLDAAAPSGPRPALARLGRRRHSVPERLPEEHTVPERYPEEVVATVRVHDVGSVDSSHEMRQA